MQAHELLCNVLDRCNLGNRPSCLNQQIMAGDLNLRTQIEAITGYLEQTISYVNSCSNIDGRDAHDI